MGYRPQSCGADPARARVAHRRHQPARGAASDPDAALPWAAADESRVACGTGHTRCDAFNPSPRGAAAAYPTNPNHWARCNANRHRPGSGG